MNSTKHIDEKFNQLFKELELDFHLQDDVDCYRWMFDKAVEFALKQQPVTKSALTTKNFHRKVEPVINTKENHMQNDQDLIPFPSFYLLDNSHELTQSEVQTLQFVLRTILNHVGQERAEAKRISKTLYKMCDKDKPETEEFFHMLNNVRNSARQQREFYLKLSKIQNKIKKMQKY